MSSIMGVTTWLDWLDAGERDEPARRLWKTSFERLIRFDRSVGTVERKLKAIRDIWERLL
jgi:hypothetical protein